MLANSIPLKFRFGLFGGGNMQSGPKSSGTTKLPTGSPVSSECFPAVAAPFFGRSSSRKQKQGQPCNDELHSTSDLHDEWVPFE